MRNNLSDLKAGDEVALASGNWNTRYTIKTIEKITPSGLIKVGGEYYHSDGSHYSAGHLERVTDDLRAEMERQELAAQVDLRLSKIRVRDMSIGALRLITQAIEIEIQNINQHKES